MQKLIEPCTNGFILDVIESSLNAGTLILTSQVQTLIQELRTMPSSEPMSEDLIEFCDRVMDAAEPA